MDLITTHKYVFNVFDQLISRAINSNDVYNQTFAFFSTLLCNDWHEAYYNAIYFYMHSLSLYSSSWHSSLNATVQLDQSIPRVLSSHRLCPSQPSNRVHRKRCLVKVPIAIDITTKNQSNFRTGLLNARSIRNKTIELHELIVDRSFDLLCITETWLHDDGSDDPFIAEMLPTGYDFVHVPRCGGYGGVGVVYRSNIKLKQHRTDGNYDSFEYILLSFPHNNSKMLTLIVIYRPPSSPIGDFMEEFDDLMNNLLVLNNNEVVLAGDFNIAINKTNVSSVNRFIELANCHDLTQYVQMPTHNQGNIIDLVYSNTDYITDLSVEDVALSDHNLVSFVLTFKTVCNEHNCFRTFRSYKDIDITAMRQDLQEMLGQPTSTTSLTEALHTYHAKLKQCVEIHAPLKTKKVNSRRTADWFDCAVTKERRIRRQLESKWRHNKNEENRARFVSQRNVVTKLILDRKRQFFSTKIAESNQKPHTLFKILNLLTNNVRKSVLPIAETDERLAQSFQDYFVSKIATIRSSVMPCNLESSSTESITSPSSADSLCSFTALSSSDVLKILMKSPSTTCRLDPLPTQLLKQLADVLIGILTFIVNASMVSGEMPDELKISIIRPLLKKPSLDSQALSNYRPVANLSFLSKVIERAVLSQLQAHLDKSQFIDVYQSAYRKHHSTETALVRVNDDLLKALDCGDMGVLMLLDLSAAFDTIDHAILRRRLAEVNIAGSALELIMSFTTCRTQFVAVNHVESNPVNVKYGVPQGSVLGPILFSLYMLPLGRLIRSHGIQHHMYADDTQLYLTFKETEMNTATTSLRQCTESLRNWMSHNFLKLNTNKTELLYVRSKFKKQKPVFPVLRFAGEDIKGKEEVRNLGAYMNECLDTDAQINRMCKSLTYQLRIISKVRKYLNIKNTRSVIQALFTSRLDYGNSLLTGAPAYQLARLQKLQNSAARIVSRTNRYQHITPVLRDLHWLPIKDRIVYKICCIVFRVLNGSAPEYISELVELHRPPRTLRSAHCGPLLKPQHSKTRGYGDRRFTVAAPKHWNELPMHIRTAPTWEQFKTRLKTHLFVARYN